MRQAVWGMQGLWNIGKHAWIPLREEDLTEKCIIWASASLCPEGPRRVVQVVGSPPPSRAHSGPAWGLAVVNQDEGEHCFSFCRGDRSVFIVCEILTQSTGRSLSASSAGVSRGLERWHVSPTAGLWSQDQISHKSPFLNDRYHAALDLLESWVYNRHISQTTWDLQGILFKMEWSAGMSEVSYTKNKSCRFCGGGRPKGRCMVGGGGYSKVKLWLPQLLAI